MATVEELRRIVGEQPGDVKQRWRLAKKLYMAGDYGSARVHLARLREEWPEKLNVARYLAATHYRMRQFNEAIETLAEAIEQWPEEMPVREQLAKVMEAADRRDAAAAVWEAILKRDPAHPLAGPSIARLRGPAVGAPQADMALPDSTGDTPVRARDCAACGAQNSGEFDRCWQCHAALDGEHFGSEASADSLPPQPAEANEPAAARLLMGAAAAAALGGAAYMTLRYGVPGATITEPRAFDSIRDALLYGLARDRLLFGGVLLIAWPTLIFFAVAVTRSTSAPLGRCFGFGVFLAAATYLATWAPASYVLPAVLACGAAALLANQAVLRLSALRGICVAAIHVPLALACAAGALIVGGSIQFSDFNEISRLNDRDGMPPAPPVQMGQTELTLPYTFVPSGSDWLDQKAGVVEFIIDPTQERAVDSLDASLWQGEQVVAAKTVTAADPVFRAEVAPNQAYNLVVSGHEGIGVRITPRSVLQIRTTL